MFDGKDKPLLEHILNSKTTRIFNFMARQINNRYLG